MGADSTKFERNEKEVHSIVFYGFPLLWNRKLGHSYEHVRLATWEPSRLGADALGAERGHWPGMRTQGAKQLCNRGGVVIEPATPAQGQWEGWQLAWSLPSKGRTVPDQGWGELARKTRRGMWFKAKKMCDLTGWSWEGRRWCPQHPCRFYCYSHFTGRKTEAQEGAISCPRSVSQGSEPELIQVWLTQKFSHRRVLFQPEAISLPLCPPWPLLRLLFCTFTFTFNYLYTITYIPVQRVRYWRAGVCALYNNKNKTTMKQEQEQMLLLIERQVGFSALYTHYSILLSSLRGRYWNHPHLPMRKHLSLVELKFNP